MNDQVMQTSAVSQTYRDFPRQRGIVVLSLPFFNVNGNKFFDAIRPHLVH